MLDQAMVGPAQPRIVETLGGLRPPRPGHYRLPRDRHGLPVELRLAPRSYGRRALRSIGIVLFLMDDALAKESRATLTEHVGRLIVASGEAPRGAGRL